MAHFEVGKKVIAIKNQAEGVFKKGDVFELLAIKKQCACVPIALLISLTLPNTTQCVCKRCGYEHPLGEAWFGSIAFAPYDDSLSELTVEDILTEKANA